MEMQLTSGGVGAWRPSCGLPVRWSSSSEARQVVGRSIMPQCTPSAGSATLVLLCTAVNSWQVNPLLKMASFVQRRWLAGQAACSQTQLPPAKC